MSDISRLQAGLDYTFSDPTLLQLALTHRSVGGKNNERLEFLGDSILNHVIAEALFHRFPKSREGPMSRMRASLVKGETLADVATELSVGDYLKLGSGERKSGGHRRRSILADTLEALFGAILLDSNVDVCRGCILGLYQSRLESLNLENAAKDAKTQLQEFVQGYNNPLPHYSLLNEDGEDHSRSFEVECRLEQPPLVVSGKGSSRRRAEQSAAKAALRELEKNGK